MAKSKSEILITQSLIDRLTDIEPWPETRAASISMYRESLKRDLEWLLNTRQPIMPALQSYPATAASIVNFGLQDISSFASSSGKDRSRLTLALEKCIRTFEPRIGHPHVFLTRSDTLNRSIKFYIEGSLTYENMEEEIKFDTVLELISGEYEVR